MSSASIENEVLSNMQIFICWSSMETLSLQ
jgi:hypothetical protein